MRSARLMGEHQGVGFMLADNEIDMRSSRLAMWHAAWQLDQRDRARAETSMQGVRLGSAVPRRRPLVQVLGASVSRDDTVVQRMFREIRPFRLYDGPSEVHRHALARRIVSV